MVLPVDCPYYNGRKANKLMKIKDMKTMDCRIINVQEGEGKHLRRMGKIEVIQENGNVCFVGTGFSDREREEIWENREVTIGRIVEVQYQEFSKLGTMRFPVFLRWRDTVENKGKKI